MKKLLKIVTYNFPQFLFLFSVAKTIILEWGRGTGKSTILAKRMIDCVLQMPRSTGMLYGETYKQIKSRTLPSTIMSLEAHGFIHKLHFFVGERPPKSWNWPEPYQPVIDVANTIFWFNGTIIVMVSQDGNASSGRGLNVDFILGDEALLWDGDKFKTDASATNRGNLYQIAYYPDGTSKYFKDCPLHHSTMLATSTPISIEGQWIFKYEEEAKDPKKSIFYHRASAEDNRENLGDDFFDNQKAIMTEDMYNAEVLNIRIGSIKDGFYPKYNEKVHCYNTYNLEYYKQLPMGGTATCAGDDDINPNLPLIAAVDWGANINCMVISQLDDGVLRILNGLHVKSPKILDDLGVEEFVPYYEPHKLTNNRLILYYDPAGNVSMANSRLTYAEQFKKILTAYGWQVELMTRGQHNQSHEDKYKLNNIMFQENDRKYPVIRFHRDNCKDLLISIKNSPAKRGTKTSIQKVKTSEKRKGFDQAHATHYSDTFDLITVGLFMHIYKGRDFNPEVKFTT